MLLLFKQQIQELFDYAKEDFFKKKCNVTFGRGDTPGNSSWWVLCLVLQILTRFQTKNVIFRLDL